jgi:hypothetical protein
MAAGWQQTSDGRWWYQNDNGTYPVESWMTIDDKEYYFDAAGYMAVNTTIDNKVIGEDGAVITATATASDAAADTAVEDTADAAAEEDAEVGTDEDLAVRTLKKLYASSDKTTLSVYSVKCETFDYVIGNREKHHLRVCLINYGKDFSDQNSRIVGYYDGGVFYTTTTPVAKFTGRTLREATDIVDMDLKSLIKKVTDDYTK